MIIKDKDWRLADDGIIEVHWKGEWLSPFQVAYLEKTLNSGSTINNRIHRAASGDPKYQKYSLHDLIYISANGKKAMLSDINRCPRLIVLLIFWVMVVKEFGENLYLKYWVHSMVSGNCGGEGFTKGVCSNCYKAGKKPRTNSERFEGLSLEAKKAERARESSPERKRAKCMSKRRYDFIPVLLGLQDEPLSYDAVKLAATCKWDDFEDDTELEEFCQILYKGYKEKWLLSTSHQKPIAALHYAETQPLNPSIEHLIRTSVKFTVKRRRDFNK
ncbi:hypothetical protein [Alkalinema sp. FACHB-956]|uniref:hypothetical protein n=1 Tax=Alkalinema sp. FACHB-956 TaxID=2692768 RepID=UPI001688A172|nr:hypothetical protein [Alkalinema sp. FACHB-956]MBD2328560.1 hypothetical protein [Alkalinema sp. FACHB-956]